MKKLCSKKLYVFDKKIFNFLLKFRVFYVYFINILFLFLIVTIFSFKNNNDYKSLKNLSTSSAEIAWNLLLIILFSKPIFKIFKLRYLFKYLTFRKELGITVFYLAFIHSLSILLFLLPASNIKILINLFFNLPYLTGAIALFILFILAISSNDFSVNFLGNLWKKIHYLAYLSLILIALHVYFIEYDYKTLIFALFFIISKLLEFLKLEIDIIKILDNKIKR